MQTAAAAARLSRRPDDREVAAQDDVQRLPKGRLGAGGDHGFRATTPRQPEADNTN